MVELAVILVTPTDYATIRRTLNHLRAQTVADRLEVILVATNPAAFSLPAEAPTNFGALRVLERAGESDVAASRAAAVRAATAPVVVFAEDHSFPEPDWAAALLAAHRGPWTAVGPAIANANPESLMSWAQLCLTYGRWVDPCSSGEVDDLPGHNSSYKRAALLEFGDALGNRLLHETMLHWELRQRGHRLYLAGDARTYHVNVSRVWSVLPDLWHGGRKFAAVRATGWPVGKRMVYVLAAPVLILREFFRHGRLVRRLPPKYRVLPALLLGLTVRGWGEAAGYAAGAGQSVDAAQSFEFHRERHVARKDKPALS